jgi:hypothetical protein
MRQHRQADATLSEVAIWKFGTFISDAMRCRDAALMLSRASSAEPTATRSPPPIHDTLIFKR